MLYCLARFVDVNRRLNISERDRDNSYPFSTCCKEMYPKCTATADGNSKNVRASQEVYKSYHGTIYNMLGEIASRFPGSHAVFIDVHAQKATEHPKVKVDAATWEHTIIVGTQDGRCVKDRRVIYSLGRSGLLANMKEEFSKGVLQSERISIYPPDNNTPGKNPNDSYFFLRNMIT